MKNKLIRIILGLCVAFILYGLYINLHTFNDFITQKHVGTTIEAPADNVIIQGQTCGTNPDCPCGCDPQMPTACNSYCNTSNCGKCTQDAQCDSGYCTSPSGVDGMCSITASDCPLCGIADCDSCLLCPDGKTGCTSNDQCASNYCQNLCNDDDCYTADGGGVCQASSCTTDSDCQNFSNCYDDEFSCSDTNYSCINGACSCGPNNGCTCESGYTCNSGTCISGICESAAANCAPCTVDGDCTSSYCDEISGTCWIDTCECGDAATCNTCPTCTMSGCTGSNENGNETGCPCNANSNCTSNLCQNNMCACINETKACTTDTQCCGYCLNGICASCSSNTDCSSGNCVNGTCASSTCVNNSDCETGNCYNSKCQCNTQDCPCVDDTSCDQDTGYYCDTNSGKCKISS